MKIDIDRVMEIAEQDEFIGICMACGFEQEGVESDARNYKCQNCNKNKVCGVEEILIGSF